MVTSEQAALKRIELKMVEMELAKNSMEFFVPYMMPSYDTQWFHRFIMRKLDEMERGGLNRMMIWLPPQTGKSELSTRMFVPYLLGKDPERKVAVVTFGDDLSKSFNRDIRTYLSSPEYRALYPNLSLGNKSGELSTLENSLSRMDIGITENGLLRRGGFVKTTSVKGSLTGQRVDFLIMDDLFKSMEDAQSASMRETVFDFWMSVANARLHNDSKVLFLMTRWHEDDLAGRLIAAQPDKWFVVRLPALKDNFVADYDPRKEGEALWPSRHSRERMLEIKQMDSLTFNALYQQDPKPPENLLVFGDWSEVSEWNPKGFKIYGIDFGFQNDPTAIIEIWVSKREIYLREILYSPKIGNDKLIQIMRKEGIARRDVVYCDTNEPKTILELRQAGFTVRKFIKGGSRQSIAPGIRKLKEFKVYFGKNSPNIRYERNNYVYTIVAGQITDDPIGKHNHAMDAIRGAVYTHFYKGRDRGGRGIRRL